jgi:hypothetical protein
MFAVAANGIDVVESVAYSVIGTRVLFGENMLDVTANLTTLVSRNVTTL